MEKELGGSAPAPPGTAFSDFARRKPSEIPSWQSLDGHPRSSGELRFRAMPPLPASLQLIKIERRQAAYKPVALTLRHVQ